MDIDFVVSWVDGNDPSWISKKNKYSLNDSMIVPDAVADAEIRYRDIGIFRYWFRAVQENAPWVRNIYVVTDNQIPGFLNINNPKIHIVKHTDIINPKFLPTFNSSTIEMNLNNIEGLSEHFVYFNDDFLICNPVLPDDFFSKDGKAKDTIGQSVILPKEVYDHNILNNVQALNDHFSKRKILKANFSQFYSLIQGPYILVLNLYLTIFPMFTRLFDPHTAYSIIKSDMVTAKKLVSKNLEVSFRNRTRGLEDITIQWIRYFQIAQGHERARRNGFGKSVTINDVQHFSKVLNSKTKILNVQDSSNLNDEEIGKIKKLLLFKYSEKSDFEI